MRISYKPLFSIECLHGYFADRVCRALTLNPTAAGARLCERHRLRFRAFRGGGTVYYEESASNLTRLRGETSPLAFALTSIDPLFGIYTDDGGGANAAPGATVRYFSNAEGHMADVNGQRRALLHPPGQPFAQPPLMVRSSRFSYRFDQPVQAVLLQVLNADRQPVWETRTPEFAVRDWPVDLRGQPDGRYRLLIAGRPAGDFYLSDEAVVRQWGVVEVFTKDINQAPTFAIAFASRGTVWRYYIFDQPPGPSSYSSYEVVGVRKRSGGTDGASNGDIRFTKRPGTVTVNGRPAFVFESRQTLPLAEVPNDDDYFFSFRPNGGSERGGRPVKLPFGQPTGTKVDATSEDGARMCSEIFVYL
jgi:hypothetical protein